MASSYVLLSNLRAGRCSNTAEVRLLRFWEARNVRKNNELMSVDLLSGEGSMKGRSILSVGSTSLEVTQNSGSLTLRSPSASVMELLSKQTLTVKRIFRLSFSDSAVRSSFWLRQTPTENSQMLLVD